MTFKTFLNQSIVYLDGGMGTRLKATRLKQGAHASVEVYDALV